MDQSELAIRPGNKCILTQGISMGDRRHLSWGIARSLWIYYRSPGRPRMDRLYSRFVRPGDLVFGIGAPSATALPARLPRRSRRASATLGQSPAQIPRPWRDSDDCSRVSSGITREYRVVDQFGNGRLKGTPRRLATIINDETLAVTEPVDGQGFKLTRFHHRLRVIGIETSAKEIAMKWKTPVIIEIAVGLEINAYACAEVK